MDQADIDKIKSAVNLADLIGQYLNLENDGESWLASCPFHLEETTSFTVIPDAGKWECLGCGMNGDAVSFLQKFKNINEDQAIAEIKEFMGHESQPETEPNPEPKADPPPKKEKPKEKKPKKSDLQQLYNYELLKQFPDNQIILIEGESSAKALQDIIGNALIILAWRGGEKGIDKYDWSSVHDRKIVIWHDNNLEGVAGSIRLTDLLYHKVKLLGCISIPQDKPTDWNCYHAINNDNMDRGQIIEFIKKNNYQPPKPEPPEKPDPGKTNLPPPTFDEKSDPFQCLGYDHGTYFYLCKGTRQVLPIKVSDHKGHLIGLAPLNYWERKYPGRNGPEWMLAINNLLRECESKGVYNMQNIRGRGAWFDSGRSVLHFGNKLLVDGKYHPILNFKSKYVYEAGMQVEHNIGSPLKTQEANKLLRLIKLFHWKKQLDADLLAGWCVLAPICGAIPWRPHVWLTGGPGTGKTFTLKYIIEPCVGDFRLYVQGNTTEAGLRQTLKSDAMPILFDESEGEDISAIKRIKAVLDLIKQSSSDTSGNIIKGTTAGRAMMFQIRSMFCMSSVGISIADEAARGRISILELYSPNKSQEDNKAHFENLNRQILSTITSKFCADLRARTIRLIPVIRKNIEVFTKAASSHFKKQRTADQYGTLLAGAYSLWDHEVVTYDQALKHLESQDWDEIETEENDSIECLNTILHAMVRMASSNNEISIAECLERIKNNIDLESADHVTTLQRHGIRVVKDMIYISDSHRAVKNILKETRWPKMWSRILRRIDGAETKKSMRFFGYPTAATGIPWNKIFTMTEEGEQLRYNF